MRQAETDKARKTLFGKILRIHPEATRALYTIRQTIVFRIAHRPQKNLAYGLRQSVSFSWGPPDARDVIAGRGQSTREEIDGAKTVQSWRRRKLRVAL